MSGVARRHHMYVVAGFLQRVGGRVFNVAAVIDREGRLVNSYAKRHPTGGEIACGITPGNEAVVIDADFGRLGLAVCFDINWPALWAEMAAKGAEIVCWLSAYEGGLPLQAYACVNVLSPGYFATDAIMHQIAIGQLNLEAIEQRTPMKRLGTMADLLGPAIFLASSESDFMCGQSLIVDGGWLAYGFLQG